MNFDMVETILKYGTDFLTVANVQKIKLNLALGLNKHLSHISLYLLLRQK